ncbi:MAG: MFS transporter [Chloroflexi bacterium]|nr:MFS transporter [Chloroflexota bacterium]
MDRRRLIVIFLIVFVNFLGGTIVLPILPLYAQRHFNAPPELITLLNSSFFLAQFLAGPILGRWSDKYGRVPLLIISQIGTVISFIMLGTAGSLTMLFAARILDGITGGNVIVAQAYITDVTPRDQRTRALGLIFMAFGLGFIFGPGLGGTLAAFFGETAPFYVGAAVTSITVLLSWLVLKESLTPEERAARRAHGRSMTPADVTGNLPLLLVLVIGFAAQFSFSMFQSTFALFGEAVLFTGRSAQETNLGVGLLLSGIGIGQFFTQLFLIQRLVKRLGEANLVLLGDVLRAFGVLTLTVFTSPWLVGPVSLIAFAVGSGLMMPSLQSLATVTVHDELRGGVLGVYQSATSLGVILGSALGGILFKLAPTTPFLVGGLLFILILLPAALLRRSPAPAVVAGD